MKEYAWLQEYSIKLIWMNQEWSNTLEIQANTFEILQMFPFRNLVLIYKLVFPTLIFVWLNGIQIYFWEKWGQETDLLLVKMLEILYL